MIAAMRWGLGARTIHITAHASGFSIIFVGRPIATTGKLGHIAGHAPATMKR
jgi:hypothetical protein